MHRSTGAARRSAGGPDLRTVALLATCLALGVTTGTFVVGSAAVPAAPPRASVPVVRPLPTAAHSQPALTGAPERNAATGAVSVSSQQSSVTPAQAPSTTPSAEPPRLDTSPDAAALPALPLTASERRGRRTEAVRCVSNGQQPKCHFRWLGVERNRLLFFTDASRPPARFPNPLYVADDQADGLRRHHRYAGHHVATVALPAADAPLPCRRVVRRPTVFLYRLSGHSTYHLWENNMGPFFATLQDFPALRHDLNDPRRLLIAFVDDKPTRGPKAPHLLDRLLRTFTDVPLLNASRFGVVTSRDAGKPEADAGGGDGDGVGDADPGGPGPVCFENAVVGTSAKGFQHFKLLYRMMRNIVGRAPPPPLPRDPNVLFVSRNHKSVVRGRKIANEAAVVAALNRTVRNATGGRKGLRYVQMETLSYPQQVALAMDTTIMVSPHGGGVANCIWMQKGAVVVEFVAPVGKTLLNMYRAMCGRSGVEQVRFLADADPADAALSDAELNHNRRLFSNMIVPPDRIVAALTTALGKHAANYAKAASTRGRAPTGEEADTDAPPVPGAAGGDDANQ